MNVNYLMNFILVSAEETASVKLTIPRDSATSRYVLGRVFRMSWMHNNMAMPQVTICLVLSACATLGLGFWLAHRDFRRICLREPSTQTRAC